MLLSYRMMMINNEESGKSLFFLCITDNEGSSSDFFNTFICETPIAAELQNGE